MIRVLHLITRLEPGGAQRNTIFTCGHLDRSRFVVGLGYGPGGELDPQAEALEEVQRFAIDAMQREIDPRADLEALSRLRRVIRDFSADIVHTHSSKAGILGRLAAHLEGVPVSLHSVHGWGHTPLQKPWWYFAFRSAERFVSKITDHAIVVAAGHADEAVEAGFLQPEQLSVIRSGIRLEPFFEASPESGAASRERLELDSGDLVVTQVGNFKPQKGPLDFVRMAALVASREPRARFVMIGRGALEPDCRRLAAELGIAEKMRFPGWTSDVPALLAATDVATMTSYHEGLPRAVVEALATGTPVVATAVDGTPEVVIDGHNGFLVPPGRPELAADRVNLLLGDPELRSTLAAAAPKGLEDFDIVRMVRMQEELYECLITSTEMS